MSDNFKNDLTTGSVSKKLLAFSLPFLISNLLQALYSVVDMVIVGQYCGKAGITGVFIGGQVAFLVNSVAIGLSVGGVVLISQYTGAKKFEERRKSIGTLLTLTLMASVIVTALMLLFMKQILGLLGIPAEAYQHTQDYYIICISGTIFMFSYNTLAAMLRGMGDSKRPLYFVAIATFVNVILDLILVGKYNMGAGGAAWATIIAQALSVVLSLIYLIKRGFFREFMPYHFKINPVTVRQIMKIAFPSIIQNTIVSFSFMTLTGLVNALPNASVASACQGIGAKVNTFAILPAAAVNGAISSMAGQNIGAGEYDRALKTMKTGMVISFSIALFVFTIIELFPGAVIRLFSNEIDVIAAGKSYFRFIAPEYLFASILFSINGLAIGAGYTNFVLLNASFSSILFRIPLSYLAAYTFNLGLNGIAIGIFSASIGGIIMGLIFLRSGKWRKSKINMHSNLE